MIIMGIWTEWPMRATIADQIAMIAREVWERQKLPSCLKRVADSAAARGSERVVNSCKW